MLTTIGIVVDVIIVAALVLFTLIGLKKGFIKSVLDLFSWLVCILVAVFLAKYVARLINHIYNFDAFIGNKIAHALVKHNNYFALPAEQFSSAPMPNLGALGTLTKAVFKNAANYGNATIAEVVGKSLGRISMIIISGILVFVLLRLILLLLNKLFKKITDIKILGWLNKLLGAAFGFIRAAAIVIILNIVLCFLTLIPPVNKSMGTLISEHTVVEKVIYKTTDKVIKNKVVDGGLMQNWLSDLWDKK